MPICRLCGAIRFHTWDGYKGHMLMVHNHHVLTEHVAIKPVRTTNRSKAQIVAEMEMAQLAKWIIV